MVDALRDENMLAVAAGDNVVRLLPPLIVSEAEIARGDAACSSAPARGSRASRSQSKQGRRDERTGAAPFPRSDRDPDAELRGMIDAEPRHEGARKRDATPPTAARRQDAGDDLREALDPHPRLLRRRACASSAARRSCSTGQEMQLGRGETIADTARVLSRYVDAIMIRILDHEALVELARHATVPVINGLTRRSHPCQVMADVMTFEEHAARSAAAPWPGPATPTTCWPPGCMRPSASISSCASRRRPSSRPKKWLLDWVKASGAAIAIGNDPGGGGARAPTASSPTPGCRWATSDGERRHNLLKPYQVNARLMARAKPDALFMHCLPAHRGEEVTDEVIDGPQSVVFDEAENRLHAQKGILAWCLHADGAEVRAGLAFRRRRR